MLDRVGLPPYLLSAYPAQLSGDQRQRVAIARALVCTPRILVCDEPTSALDVSVQAQILNLLAELRRDLGLTMVLISHNLAVVSHLADRVAVMYLGRIVERGETAPMYAAAAHPYTRALLGSILPARPNATLPEIELKGEFPSALDPPGGCSFHPRCGSAETVCASNDPGMTESEGRGWRCHFPLAAPVRV